ncbi:hypothetical protein MFIFM68171_10625 [Madurella fahalii]|uniref:Thioredoxin domain-containing protein n=1 Tax=Madurella fahalii TaxID=1157608 RepID=A0ABQ0GRP4_9PEZI
MASSQLQAPPPPAKQVAPIPQPGDRAPPLGDDIQFPRAKPALVVFLRHCGCPFAEKTFKILTSLSTRHPEIDCIAVSQSSRPDTDKWVVQVGGEWEVHVLVDPERDLFAAWGLGTSSTWYAVNPWTVWSAFRLARDEGIWSREEESGSRWQIGGAFAVDANGFVRWAKPAASADEVPDFKEGLKALAEWSGLP